jgi:hypothetical protein
MASEGNFCVKHKSSWAGVVTSEGVTWFGLSIIAVIVCISTVVVHLLLRVIGRRNYVVDRKFDELGALIKTTAIRMATIAARDGESTEWLNLLLQNAWVSFAKRYHLVVSRSLQFSLKPASLSVTKYFRRCQKI